jgi:glycosyltransferase involved in cell wall biosynthesis
MKITTETPRIRTNPDKENSRLEKPPVFPRVSVIVPAYNEAFIFEENLGRIYRYMQELEIKGQWELIVINDGSQDDTGAMAERFAAGRDRVKVFHHPVNRNLGAALQTGFRQATGDYVLVLDLDLTYSVEHIGRLLSAIMHSDADIVLASPYMKGGRNTGVPIVRLIMSKAVNRLLRLMSPANIHTFTGMVRAYRKSFLRKLNLKSSTYNINPEIIFKAFILRARIEEIPAHLDWSNQTKKERTSSIRIFDGVLSGLMSGFIFRPYLFFMGVGLILLLLSLYIILWIFIQTFGVLPDIPAIAGNFEDRFGMAVGQIFSERPYSFMVGGICLIVSFQFLGIGFLSLQNKRYFDELFHISSSLLERQFENKYEDNSEHE